MFLKFRCERDDLLQALSIAVRGVAGATSGRPVLTGMHFDLKGELLTVTGSDLDLTLSATVDVTGETDGTTVVPAKLLVDVIRSIPSGAVDFAIDGNEVTVVAGASEFQIRLIEADEYPQLGFTTDDGDVDEVGEGGSFSHIIKLASSQFRDALRQVVKSASSDDTRPILTGVLMTTEGDGDIRFVATDSYRLAMRDLQGSFTLGDQQKVLVPSRALYELQRLISDTDEVTLKLAKQYAQFEVASVRLTTRLIPGDFPNYSGLIPDDLSNRLTVDREQMLEVVKRVRILAQESLPVRLEMTSEGLKVLATTQDVGRASESMSANYEGEDLTVAFNPSYLIDGLEAVTGDEVILSTVNASKPALLQSVNGDGLLYLLMPVRV